MGVEWLNRVQEVLQQAGFRTAAGYPAHKAVALKETVAAVNLNAMDDSSVREILVTVLTPRNQGLQTCQEKAAQVVQALSTDHNRWSFRGWRYEAGIDCWAVEIYGTAVEDVPEEQTPVGYIVRVGGQEQSWVTDFSATQNLDRRFIHPHWQDLPAGVIPGKKGWVLKLTQLFPQGEGDLPAEEEPFSLTVDRGSSRQVYSGCYWQSVSLREKPEGSEVVRSAYALNREVNTDGQNEV